KTANRNARMGHRVTRAKPRNHRAARLALIRANPGRSLVDTLTWRYIGPKAPTQRRSCAAEVSNGATSVVWSGSGTRSFSFLCRRGHKRRLKTPGRRVDAASLVRW